MPKKNKPTKALENCARGIKDTDEFVEHVANIAARYRREHALDGASRNRAQRKSLRDFHKHAAALAAWLRQAHKATAEHDALSKIGAILYGVPGLALAESASVLTWLTRAEQASARCMADAKTSSRKPQATAPRIAAEALRATFEHHKIKWSTALTRQKQSDAIRALCAIAKSAGDGALSLEAAREVLREVSGKTT